MTVELGARIQRDASRRSRPSGRAAVPAWLHVRKHASADVVLALETLHRIGRARTFIAAVYVVARRLGWRR